MAHSRPSTCALDQSTYTNDDCFLAGTAKQTQAKSTIKQAERMHYLTSSAHPPVSAATARVVQLLPCCFLTNQLCLAHRSEQVSLQAAAVFAAFTQEQAVQL